MSTSSETLMQSCFPSLEVTVVNDIFSQCNSDPQTAIEQLCLLFPEAYVVETQGQAQHQETVPEPWTPPSQSPAQSPKRLTKGISTPSRPPGSLNPDFMQVMFPTSPPRSKKNPPEGSTRLNGQSRDMLSQFNKIDCVKTDTSDDRTLVNEYSNASDKGKQQVAHPAHASLPFLQHLLPLEKPLAKASPNGSPTGLSPVRTVLLSCLGNCCNPRRGTSMSCVDSVMRPLGVPVWSLAYMLRYCTILLCSSTLSG